MPLPYLPLVEAIGNYLDGQDVARLAASLGSARRELAQLYPQLAGDEAIAPVGDPAQAKLRLFEAVVALLAVPAREQGLLLIVEDIHWADAATRELLDHLARRLAGLRLLVLVTYRSDELDRRHPLAPVLQAWRRSSVAEVVSLLPLDEDQLAEMIAAILDESVVGHDFRHLMHVRTEGNPFVIEEMLREAIERGDVFRNEDGWHRRSLDELRIPESVRDTILFRFARLDPDDSHILEAAAVLGRVFDYAILVAVAGADDAAVHRALSVGVAQQLLDEFDGRTATYRWRHALTQEAVADEVVMPRRQEINSRAADAAESAGATPLRLARLLLGAGRFDVSDLVDSYRDLLTSAMDVYLSSVSNRLNVVMKQLAVIATIFLPLSFVVGFFGQNFSWMVTHITGGWTFLLLGVGSEIVVLLAFIYLFKRRGWF